MQKKIPIIRIEGLTKVFENRIAVHGLDFSVEEGKCIALLGPNGAGKTTTINMILGLVIPTKGKITIFGQSLSNHLSAIKQKIGVAPQSDNLDPDLTVLENLIIYASYFRIPRHLALKRAKELLRFFALESRHNEIIQNLSGGQRRRLIIARALINEPLLLILDEPTIGLDPQARHLIWDRLDILKREGTTMLLTSHYMEEVSRLADHVIIMEQGKKLIEGEPQALIAEHVGDSVFEVERDDFDLTILQKELSGCNCTFEIHGTRLYIYTKGPCPEAERLSLRFSHVIKRPANLEDLFLRYTGRKFVEG